MTDVFTSSDISKLNRKINSLVFAVEMLLGFFMILAGKVTNLFAIIAIGVIYILFISIFAFIKWTWGGKHG